MEAGMYDKILADGFNGEIKYKPGFGPVTARAVSYTHLDVYKRQL